MSEAGAVERKKEYVIVIDRIRFNNIIFIWVRRRRGVATVTLNLENKKLGDEEIIRLAEMDILAEVTNLELGENNISDKGLAALCSSLLTKKIKVLNLKSNNIRSYCLK